MVLCAQIGKSHLNAVEQPISTRYEAFAGLCRILDEIQIIT